MGFDLSGMNPNMSSPEPIWSEGYPWSEEGQEQKLKDPTFEQRYEDYWKERNKWQDENCGTYFRNNVWFWRPLWNFVCRSCDHILTDKDIERGNYNDGHKISKTKANRIAKKLFKLIETDQVKAYESMYKKEQSKLSEDDWNKSYPFSEENVRQFANFCLNSGGFRIC